MIVPQISQQFLAKPHSHDTYSKAQNKKINPKRTNCVVISNVTPMATHEQYSTSDSRIQTCLRHI